MPNNRDFAKFASIIGFLIVIGIVAAEFGLGLKLVLLALAAFATFACASFVDGYIRSGMFTIGALLGLVALYILAFDCDAECQIAKQKVAEARAVTNAKAQMATEAALYPGCDRVKRAVRFDTAPVLINEAARCATDLWHEGHCIYVRQAGRNERLGPFCAGATYQQLPVGVEYVWSADQPFDGFVRLAPPRYVR